MTPTVVPDLGPLAAEVERIDGLMAVVGADDALLWAELCAMRRAAELHLERAVRDARAVAPRLPEARS